ncbi:MAG: glycosyltransferase family 2 protein [Rhodocyclaceae bacterium]|nr:MAG: glycosyltransferase family 2 protein [Rhodocyclaceae bacterium]
MATFDVLLPVRNGIDYLAQALDSIQSQSFRDWRLLVLDHGSSDGSTELARAYGERDRRIQVHVMADAPDLSALLNRGLDLCDCRYVLRQDADDISLPDRMAELARAFTADPELVLAASLGDVIDGRGRIIGRIDMPTGPWGMRAGALFRTPTAHPAVALRLDALVRLGARYGEDFIGAVAPAARLRVPGLAEDYFLFGQLALTCRCVNLARKLIRYRWHGANVGAVHASAQMKMALDISRYLAESLAIMQGTASFDPAPFCNHGERLFDMGEGRDFSEAYRVMEQILSRVMPPGPELRRELAFRKLLARRDAAMALRYGIFLGRHGFRPSEWRTVKSWLLRNSRRQPLVRAGVVSTTESRRTADAGY